jgi:hypothetical protein
MRCGCPAAASGARDVHPRPTAHSSTTAISKPAAAPRLDLYAPIHKALRLFMGDTLARVGRIDLSDSADSSATLQQLDALLELCRGHVAHENQHLHPALEARRPGASQRIGAEHDEHLDAIAALGADVAALRALPSAAAAHRLYRHLAVFIGENLVHMNVEETAHNATLWELCSDAELQDIHQRIMASVGPDELALVLRWMVPALSPAERADSFGVTTGTVSMVLATAISSSAVKVSLVITPCPAGCWRR